MGNLIEMEGCKFGLLTVIKRQGIDSSGKPTWLCICDCGKQHIASGKRLRNGKTQSCGCNQREAARTANTKHGLSRGSKLWWVYHAMKARCYNPKNKSFVNYGGRGIQIDDLWLGEEGYVNFYNWAISNGYTEGLTLERIDNNGNYAPHNCAWRDLLTQAKNRRVQKSNTSGYPGVFFRKERGDWRVSITVDKKKISLGCFKDYDAAVEKRKQAEIEYWGHVGYETN